jgi:hypothetical protein
MYRIMHLRENERLMIGRIWRGGKCKGIKNRIKILSKIFVKLV